jgi:hypothetical protein
MTTASAPTTRADYDHNDKRPVVGHEHDAQRRSTETKSSAKTTELMVYIGAVIAIVVTALVVGSDGHGADPFSALDAIRYISYVSIGYMIARGLAKSGSRENYDHERNTH